ncbi:MAG TPA: hypothetical protein DCR93_22855 [Cytophagales bacterium]|nr:hypothetical protein [Cytophagales bacterium]HAP62216.1 hypothetical protein [Cytophagales bacterium]
MLPLPDHPATHTYPKGTLSAEAIYQHHGCCMVGEPIIPMPLMEKRKVSAQKIRHGPFEDSVAPKPSNLNPENQDHGTHANTIPSCNALIREGAAQASFGQEQDRRSHAAEEELPLWPVEVSLGGFGMHHAHLLHGSGMSYLPGERFALALTLVTNGLVIAPKGYDDIQLDHFALLHDREQCPVINPAS